MLDYGRGRWAVSQKPKFIPLPCFLYRILLFSNMLFFSLRIFSLLIIIFYYFCTSQQTWRNQTRSHSCCYAFIFTSGFLTTCHAQLLNLKALSMAQWRNMYGLIRIYFCVFSCSRIWSLFQYHHSIIPSFLCFYPFLFILKEDVIHSTLFFLNGEVPK